MARQPSAKTLVDRQLGRNRKDVIPAGDTYRIPNHSGIKNFTAERPEWDDQQVNLGSVGFGASAPTRTTYKGGEVLAFNKAQDNSITFTAQLTHAYKIGSNIDFHLHVVHPDNGAGSSRWKLTYSWADIGSAFPAETTVYKNFTNSGQDIHQYAEIKEGISDGVSGVSSILICSLTREGTDLADTYDNDVYLVALDFHILKDTMGSELETQKWT